MSSYEKEMKNQNHLIELGKQLNVKETLKKNQENYLEIALREIEEGLIDAETLEKTLEEDILLDQFSSSKPKESDIIG